MTAGILFSQMEPPSGWDAEFHQWYEDEHIPSRLAIEGFDAATRYRALDGYPAYLAVYELSDLGALQTPEYATLKESPTQRTAQMLSSVEGFTRFTCELCSDTGPAAAPSHLSVVCFSVPQRELEDFDDWYETEHIPALLKASDWLRVRRYRVLSGEGGPWTDIALHELASREVMQSPQREAARKGPKRDELARRPWFGQSGRWLYEVISHKS
jgi:hypothetical protein